MKLETYITNAIFTAPITGTPSTTESIYRTERHDAIELELFNELKYNPVRSFRWFERVAGGYREIQAQWTLEDLSQTFNLSFEIFEREGEPEWLDDAIAELTALFDTRAVIG